MTEDEARQKMEEWRLACIERGLDSEMEQGKLWLEMGLDKPFKTKKGSVGYCKFVPWNHPKRFIPTPSI